LACMNFSISVEFTGMLVEQGDAFPGFVIFSTKHAK